MDDERSIFEVDGVYSYYKKGFWHTLCVLERVNNILTFLLETGVKQKAKIHVTEDLEAEYIILPHTNTIVDSDDLYL